MPEVTSHHWSSGKVLGSNSWLHLGIKATRTLSTTLPYLWVLEAADVRVQVEFDAFTSTWQGQSTDKQHQKHGKRESGGEVDDLEGQEGVR